MYFKLYISSFDSLPECSIFPFTYFAG